MLGAGAAGLGLSQLTWSPELKPGDIVTLNGLAAGGAVLGGGLALLDSDRGSQSSARLIVATTAAGLVGGRLLTRHLSFSPGDRSLLALGLAEGTLVGAMLPSFFESNASGTRHLGGTLVGASVGTLAAVGLSQLTDYSSGDVGRMFLFDALGSATGLGTMLMAKSDSTSSLDAQRGVLLGSLAGLAVASQLAPRMELSRGDPALVGLGTGWGAWQGLGLTLGLDSSGATTGGATLLGLGLGGLGGLGLTQLLDVSPGQVAAAGSGALWGGWLMTSAQLAWGELDRSDTLLVLVASDVGLGVATLLLSPLVDVRPGQIGVASLGGLGGGVLFTLGGGLFTRDSRTLLQANFIGSGVGLLVGGLIAARLSPAATEAPAQAGGAGGAGLPSVSFQGLSSTPLLNPDGAMGGVAVVARFEND